MKITKDAKEVRGNRFFTFAGMMSLTLNFII